MYQPRFATSVKFSSETKKGEVSGLPEFAKHELRYTLTRTEADHTPFADVIFTCERETVVDAISTLNDNAKKVLGFMDLLDGCSDWTSLGKRFKQCTDICFDVEETDIIGNFPNKIHASEILLRMPKSKSEFAFLKFPLIVCTPDAWVNSSKATADFGEIKLLIEVKASNKSALSVLRLVRECMALDAFETELFKASEARSNVFPWHEDTAGFAEYVFRAVTEMRGWTVDKTDRTEEQNPFGIELPPDSDSDYDSDLSDDDEEEEEEEEEEESENPKSKKRGAATKSKAPPPKKSRMRLKKNKYARYKITVSSNFLSRTAFGTNEVSAYRRFLKELNN